MNLTAACRTAVAATLLLLAGCAGRDDRDVHELRQRVDTLEKRLASMPAGGSQAAPAHAGGHASAPHQLPEAAFAALIEGNRAFVDGAPRKADLSASRRKELAAGQQPLAAIVACADSRCPPEHVFGAGLGEVFIVRSAGNVIDRAGVASLEYAVAHLGVRLIALVGHESCGAVKAALADAHDTPAVSELVAKIKPAITPGPGDALVRTVGANAVLQRQALLDGSEMLAGMARTHEVRIAVGVQQLASGEVVWLDRDGLAPPPAEPPARTAPAPSAKPARPAADHPH